jgi:hypothetical protein
MVREVARESPAGNAGTFFITRKKAFMIVGLIVVIIDRQYRSELPLLQTATLLQAAAKEKRLSRHTVVMINLGKL